MNDLISRKEVLKLPRRKGYAVNGWEEYIRVDDIEDLPSAQPNEDLLHLQKEQAYLQGYEDGKKSRKGKWIKIMKTNESKTATFYTPTWICGDCKTEYDGAIANSIIKFCYNCGADMRGEQDE